MALSTFYGKRNNAKTTITNNPLSNSGLSITLAAGTGSKFPSSGTFLVTIWDDTTYPNNPTGDPNMEVCLIDSRSTDTLTVNASGRGYAGTTGVQHASGSSLAITVMREHMEQYETAIGSLETLTQTGWIPAGATFTYTSVDDPTGVIATSIDLRSQISVGMRLKFVNGGNTIYAIVTAITSNSITFLHEIDPSDSQALTLMANSAITSPHYSPFKTPNGFPSDPRKWTFYLNLNAGSQASPSAGTFYMPGSNSLAIPIGVWNVDCQVRIYGEKAGATVNLQFALSTSSSSVSDNDLQIQYEGITAGGGLQLPYIRKVLALAAKTTYNAILKTGTASATNIQILNDTTYGKSYIYCVCAYL